MKIRTSSCHIYKNMKEKEKSSVKTSPSGETVNYFATLGASNHSSSTRHADDYYATDPIAVDLLLSKYKGLGHNILEPCCGEGHTSKQLIAHGYTVISEDLIYRGYGKGGCDFLKRLQLPSGISSIVTNFPFKLVLDCTLHALSLLPEKGVLASFVRLNFLEGQERYQKLFSVTPPKHVFVFPKRIRCGKDGIFPDTSAVAYSWLVFEKGWSGSSTLDWLS